MSRWLSIVLLSFVLFAACGGGTKNPTPGAVTGPVYAGSAQKVKTSLRAFHGKPVVVNYWATWCDPCKAEMPRLVAAARRFSTRVHFLGVNVEDDITSARMFARRYRIPFRSWAVSKAEIQQSQDILGLPVTQFYDVNGGLAFVNQGEISSSDLTRRIEELLQLGRPVEHP